MSKVTDGFEERAWIRAFANHHEWSIDEVLGLLAHARALEQMLRNIRNDPMLTLRVQQVWEINELLECEEV